MNPIKIVLAGLAAATAVAACSAQPRIPLRIEYPKPAYDGTPKPIEGVKNLEPARQRAPELLVSRQTTLLSHGRPVRSSDSVPVVGELSLVTDGDKAGMDGTYVELGPGPQWVQIDLGASARIQAIAVWHYHAQARVYHDVVVQVSDDPAFVRNVVTVFNTDDDASLKRGRGRDRPYIESRFGRLIDAKGAAGRYVRLYSRGNTSDELNHYCEVEVYGDPAAKT